MSKYGNKPAKIDGYRFDSQAEARRYEQLKLLVAAKEICMLEVHPSFPLHAGIIYEGDFRYCIRRNDAPWTHVVEDVKGAQTAVFKLKAKLFRADYPDIDFRIIPASEV